MMALSVPFTDQNSVSESPGRTACASVVKYSMLKLPELVLWRVGVKLLNAEYVDVAPINGVGDGSTRAGCNLRRLIRRGGVHHAGEGDRCRRRSREGWTRRRQDRFRIRAASGQEDDQQQ